MEKVPENHTLSDCWNDIDCVETNYEKWSDKLNSILHDCFPKHRIKKSKQIYDNRIRQLISKRKNLKKQARSDKTDVTMQHRIVKLDQKIDKKTANSIPDFSRRKLKNMVVSVNRNFGSLTLFDMGGMMAPQNVFDHCAQTLRKRKLKLGDF